MKRVALIDTQIPSYVCLSLPSLPPSHDVHPSLLSLSSLSPLPSLLSLSSSLSLFPLSLPSLSSFACLVSSSPSLALTGSEVAAVSAGGHLCAERQVGCGAGGAPRQLRASRR